MGQYHERERSKERLQRGTYREAHRAILRLLTHPKTRPFIGEEEKTGRLVVVGRELVFRPNPDELIEITTYDDRGVDPATDIITFRRFPSGRYTPFYEQYTLVDDTTRVFGSWAPLEDPTRNAFLIERLAGHTANRSGTVELGDRDEGGQEFDTISDAKGIEFLQKLDSLIADLEKRGELPRLP